MKPDRELLIVVARVTISISSRAKSCITYAVVFHNIGLTQHSVESIAQRSSVVCARQTFTCALNQQGLVGEMAIICYVYRAICHSNSMTSIQVSGSFYVDLGCRFSRSNKKQRLFLLLTERTTGSGMGKETIAGSKQIKRECNELNGSWARGLRLAHIAT